MGLIHRDSADFDWRPGDIAICGIVVVGTTTPPGVPSGATAINAGIGTSAGGGGNTASRMFQKILADGDTGFGSFSSNATTDDWAAVVGVYRGQDGTPIGKLGTSLAGAGPTITFPAVASPLNDTDSWVLTFGCANNTNIAVSSTPPTGTVLRDVINGAGGANGCIGLFDTSAVVSSFAQATTSSGSGGARTGMSFELRGASATALQFVSAATSGGGTTPGNPTLPSQSKGRSFFGWLEMSDRRRILVPHRRVWVPGGLMVPGRSAA